MWHLNLFSRIRVKIFIHAYSILYSKLWWFRIYTDLTAYYIMSVSIYLSIYLYRPIDRQTARQLARQSDRQIDRYSRLSLSRSPRDSLKYFEISVSRHIRFAELRKKINQKTIFHIRQCNLTPENRDILKILWKKGEIAPISPLFHIILLPVVIVSC